MQRIPIDNKYFIFDLFSSIQNKTPTLLYVDFLQKLKPLFNKLKCISMKAQRERLQYFDNVSPKQKSPVSVSPSSNKKKFQSQSIVQQQIKQNGTIVIRRSSSVQYQSKVVPHYVQALNQQILKKKQQMNDQMNKLDKNIEKSKKQLQNAKNKVIEDRLMQLQAIKNKQLKKKQEIIKKVSQWSKERQELEKHRQKERLKRQQILKQQQMKKKEEEQKYNQFSKLEKRKQIELRIKDMEKRREQRMQHQSEQLKNHSSLTSIPKYKLLEKQFINRKQNLEMQLSLSKKKQKVQKALDPQQIKAHEKAYIERIKERLNMKKKEEASEGQIRRKVKSQFNLYLNRKDEMLKMELQKFKKRQKFQQKIRQIPVHVDQKKRLQREIAADKADNPLKYNFLSQKALSQEQIFKQFKDFQMNIDSKKLGKQYLQKLKAQPRTRISKSTLVQKVEAASEKPQYKNYLQEVKIKKRPKLDQFQQLKRQYKNDRKIGSQVLGKKSEEYEGKALKKIKELKIANTYEESVKKQSQIDDMYTKSLKARIAVLQLN